MPSVRLGQVRASRAATCSGDGSRRCSAGLRFASIQPATRWISSPHQRVQPRRGTHFLVAGGLFVHRSTARDGQPRVAFLWIPNAAVLSDLAHHLRFDLPISGRSFVSGLQLRDSARSRVGLGAIWITDDNGGPNLTSPSRALSLPTPPGHEAHLRRRAPLRASRSRPFVSNMRARPRRWYSS